jgi:hypothetical protein
VNKDHFIKVLHHYSESSTQEAEDVLLLKKDYPYSQVLHTLSARVSKDHGFSSQQVELQLAAIYAADRTVLKEIMTFEMEENDEETPETRPAETPVQRIFVPPAPSAGNDDLATEVIHDLERLNELRHNFEMMFVEVPPVVYQPPTPQPQEVISEQLPVEEPKTVTIIPEVPVRATREVSLQREQPRKEESHIEDPGQKEHTKSRKERIIELAKARNPVTEQPAAPANHPGVETPRIKARPPRRRKEEGESLIDEIASTKAEIVPENDKQKEQIDMIDQFIKSQPSFANAKEKPNQPVSDLTAIKTGEFADSIVSETLVEILIKQGKKDKAVEVLKKLIWKFPQKKAYFAAQIEELKK